MHDSDLDLGDLDEPVSGTLLIRLLVTAGAVLDHTSHLRCSLFTQGEEQQFRPWAAEKRGLSALK